MASQAFQWLGASQGIDGTPDAAIFDDDDMNDYQLLKRAFMNEKASPEILPFQEDLVSRLYMQMNQQVGLEYFSLLRRVYLFISGLEVSHYQW